MSFQNYKAEWAQDAPLFAQRGVTIPGIQAYLPPEFKFNYNLAMDAQPTLSTDPNSGVPSLLTTMIDPEVFRILFSPNKAATILSEVRKGSWLDNTALFPTVEQGGEVSSYGDYSENGHTTVNTNWPQRQAYLFQIIKEYGERELEMAGLARLNWVAEQDAAAALSLNKYSNLTYFFGVAGLQNYGLLNDPNLSAALTPSTKTAGGTKWVLNGVVNATANEIYLDIESMFIKLVQQTSGLIDRESSMTMAMSPQSETAFTATNSFGVNVSDLVKKNFPNMTVKTAMQYGALSTTNPQGIAGGELVQLIVGDIEGQKTGYCAFNEKMRAHPIIRFLSSFRQKVSGGTWGAIIRQPMGISQMLGV